MIGIRQSLYFGMQRIFGHEAGRYYREFLSLERSDRPAVDNLQAERLEALLAHASQQVPFYRDRASAARSLASFPVVTKQDLAERHRDFMTDDLRAEYESGQGPSRPFSWSAVKTGGTTGTPVVVVHDRTFRDRGRASRLFSQDLCGFPFGTPYGRLWGSMQELNAMRDSLPQRVQRALAGEVLLNAFRMDDEAMRAYLARMQRAGIRHLMAYIDAACELASYGQRTGYAVPQLETIMACAGTVTADARALLTRVFGARIHNKYGSRECTDIACECDRGGFHIYSHHVIVEVVDAAGRAVAPGATGRILITLLGNLSFPLIRYDIGDMGSLVRDVCPCGRPWPLFGVVEGRAVEFLRGPSGNYVSPVYIRHLIGVVHNPGFIRKFQLVQESSAAFALKLVMDPATPSERRDDAMKAIAGDLKAVLGDHAELAVAEVASLPDPVSGKFLYTVNRSSR